MIGIGKNNYKALATIAALASLLIVNAVTIGTGGGHIAFASHHDNIKVFENSHINLQTDSNQDQGCETAGGTSPISDSCTASSTDTISQGTVPPSPPPPCTPTMHPTVLTLNAIGINPTMATGTLTDTCTGSGVTGATITFTGTGAGVHIVNAVTSTGGAFIASINIVALPAGTYTVQAHFAGQGIFGPSNSGTQTYTVS